MTRLEFLLAEFTHETNTTRKHLERLPTQQFTWRPHEKSFSAGHLASHIVDCVRWVEPIFTANELDLDPLTYQSFDAQSSEHLLTTYDAAVATGKQIMMSCGDHAVIQPWRFNMLGKLRWEKSREQVFRDMMLHHLIHHRGQFSVYLRLIDVAVPGSYGPTADDRR